MLYANDNSRCGKYAPDLFDDVQSEVKTINLQNHHELNPKAIEIPVQILPAQKKEPTGMLAGGFQLAPVEQVKITPVGDDIKRGSPNLPVPSTGRLELQPCLMTDQKTVITKVPVVMTQANTGLCCQPGATPEPARLTIALSSANQGYKIFPCDGKKPLTSNGFKDATDDAEIIKRRWGQWPAANIGMPTGEINKIAVIDIDNKPDKGKDGISELQKLQAKHGNVPDTFTVKTPSGGLHLYFKHKAGFKNSTDKLANGIDTRGDGGYIIAPGSSIGEKHYVIEKNIPLADLPDWVFDAVVNQPKNQKESETLIQHTPGVSGENRSDQRQPSEEEVTAALNSIDPDCPYLTWIEVGQALHAWNSVRGLVLWNEWSSKGSKYKDGECQRKWNSFTSDRGINIATLFHHAKTAGWKPDIVTFSYDDPVKAARANDPWPMTDAGNAERLAHYMRGKLVFDERMQCWRCFNGKKWEVDNVMWSLCLC